VQNEATISNLFVPDIGNCYFYHFITRLIHVRDRSKTH